MGPKPILSPGFLPNLTLPSLLGVLLRSLMFPDPFAYPWAPSEALFPGHLPFSRLVICLGGVPRSLPLRSSPPSVLEVNHLDIFVCVMGLFPALPLLVPARLSNLFIFNFTGVTLPDLVSLTSFILSLPSSGSDHSCLFPSGFNEEIVFLPWDSGLPFHSLPTFTQGL